MRKSIFDIAAESINMSNEVERIYNMSLTEKNLSNYCSYTLFDFVDKYCFKEWRHRNHFLDVLDFLKSINYKEIRTKAKDGDVDSFIQLIEVTYNLSCCDMSIDWEFYLTELKKVDIRLYELLNDAFPIIESGQTNGNHARKKLSRIVSICHNDMDCKNVLWSGKDYRIIDLECLSYNNPFVELFEMALCWSGYERRKIDFQLFQSFLQGYKNAGGEMPVDWETLYDCNNGRLEWLEYNIKRVLGVDCGADEKEIGINQVEETIQHIVYYSNMKEQILEHCVL